MMMEDFLRFEYNKWSYALEDINIFNANRKKFLFALYFLFVNCM